MSDLLTSDLLLEAYRKGVFPMAEDRNATEVFWVRPRFRGILPLNGFHVSRSLAKTVRRGGFTATADMAFEAVVEGCADREETWINGPIFDVYRKLHAEGHAHSVEIWAEKTLVGGVYGVAIGAAFFGESMFSTRTDASKVALLCAVDRLRRAGFTLFDTQFLTAHLASLGGIEIPRARYEVLLAEALTNQAAFGGPGPVPVDQALVQRMTQTS
ncbi:leucyl/phenylalanyl-tRNA--protein transferase [Salipiger sp. IMCC34102]|uniref:leucyl/phenylalanyl-tRNA--protein transferase n=1 Tax=Salipiger sp. IMCC34102 TaxID=2510647 RepID=UPI00101C0088|nr:leucyl/phenylalanyl-tRNA--protein transferase [Salipiger sp. IMCC34102]RYH02718.1 leucyl/phenylalanyl-tRNA--protein transferase [Salipiger sp. IMCC34102]